MRRCIEWSLLVWCTGSAALTLLVVCMVYVDELGLGLKLHLPGQASGVPVTQATNGTNWAGVGFVLMGVGPVARQLKCEGAVESLRYRAGWQGPVYLITDAPQCFRHKQWDACGLDATVVAVNSETPNNLSQANSRLAVGKGSWAHTNGYKMHIFEVVQDPGIDVLVYMDCSVLASNEPAGCLADFLGEYVDSFDSNRRILVSQKDEDSEVDTSFFVAHRKWSGPVLKQWYEQRANDEVASDQGVFGRGGITEHAFIDDTRFLYRPRCGEQDCRVTQPRCFNHVSASHCSSRESKEVQSFVDRWSLCSYNGLDHCVDFSSEQSGWSGHKTCVKPGGTQISRRLQSMSG